jgi:hypothetical protein
VPAPRYPSPPKFGFVCSQRHPSSRPGTPKLGLFVQPAPNRLPPKIGLRHEAKRFNREIRQIREGNPQSASFFAWFAYFAVTFFSCVFKSSIINHTVPLSRGRVARIAPEFRARGRPPSHITPCTEGNKKFLARGCFPFSTVAQTVRAAQGMEAAGWRPEDRVGRAWVPKRHSSRVGSPFPLAKELHSTAEDAEDGGLRTESARRPGTGY